MLVEVKKRERLGTAAAKADRRQNLVPGTVYGRSFEATSILMDMKVLDGIVKKLGANAVFDISIEGAENQQVMLENIARDPVRLTPLNVELRALEAGQKVLVRVPIILEGADSISFGIVTQTLADVEIEVAASDVPQHFTLDISELEVGENLTVADLKIGDDIDVITDLEEAVVILSAPAVEEEETEEDAEGAEPAAGEETDAAAEPADAGEEA